MTIDDVDLISETGSKVKAGPSYERVYLVQFSGGWRCEDLINHTESSLPKVGNLHPHDNKAICRTVKATLADNEGGVGEGAALYTANFEPLEGGATEADPRSAPPRISWGGAGLTKVPTEDIEGAALVNSAGDLYDGIPEYPIRGSSCTITRVELSNPAATVNNFSNSTNADTWYGVSAGNGVLGEITAEKQYATYAGEDIEWWEVSYPMRFRRDGWALKLIDNGWRYDTGGGVIRSKTDDMGQTPPQPILLDGEGGELASGGEPVIYPEDGYTMLEETGWGSLNLPNPFA